ncbi:MAG: lytic transglycosylase domain-containing protein [Acidobacteriota bacterium]|nr:lytic transglycosylase domain-containing protein [Blastocatellia bacterium]MDW8411757.1 lytic transglycosylase domain-containing protein [Acidobacteriota bacterium]
MPSNRLLFGTATILLAVPLTDAFASQKPVAVSQEVTSQLLTSDKLQRVISQAEQYYKLGEEYFRSGNFMAAKIAFDRAVDVYLESSAEIRQDPSFRSSYLNLIERIYKHQLVASQAGIEGFDRQLYDISPLDELSKLDLAEVATEQKVETGQLDFEFTVATPIYQFIHFFSKGKGRVTMETGLRRSGKYRAMAERIFKEEGIPLDLIWLAQVESVWMPHALSSASAKGIWQFIPSTGARFGLRQDSYIDERVSPEKSTRAAAKYLKFLHDFFAGDWMLAMAAYNCGEYGVDRAIASCGYADFWELYNRNLLPQETRNYVPAILAVAIIAKDPAKYGFEVQPDPEWTYDSIELEAQLDLRVVSELLSVPYETLRELNPELKRGITPPGYTLRLPKNYAEKLTLALSRLEPSQYLAANQQKTPGYKRKRDRYSVTVVSRRNGAIRKHSMVSKRVYKR